MIYVTCALVALACGNALLTFGAWLEFRDMKFSSYEHETAEAAALALSGYSTVLTLIILWLVAS